MLRSMLFLRQLTTTRNTPRSFIHTSLFAAKRITEVVPALGESITEGSIAKWNKQEGEAVNADDVIVVVETDKVTVDIKANFKGIVTKHLVKDNVEVGKPLYEIEVDESAASAVSATTSSTTNNNNATTATSSTTTTTTSSSTQSGSTSSSASHHPHHQHQHRQPLIRFLGKRSLLNHHNNAPANTTSSSNTTTTSAKSPVASAHTFIQPSAAGGVAWPAPKKPQTGVDMHTLKDAAMFGRPKLSAKEIAAIESGGAF